MPPHPPIFNPFFLFNNFSSPYSHKKKKKISCPYQSTLLIHFFDHFFLVYWLLFLLILLCINLVSFIPYFSHKKWEYSLSLSLYIYIYKLSLGLSYNSNLGWFFFFFEDLITSLWFRCNEGDHCVWSTQPLKDVQVERFRRLGFMPSWFFLVF